MSFASFGVDALVFITSRYLETIVLEALAAQGLCPRQLFLFDPRFIADQDWVGVFASVDLVAEDDKLRLSIGIDTVEGSVRPPGESSTTDRVHIGVDFSVGQSGQDLTLDLGGIRTTADLSSLTMPGLSLSLAPGDSVVARRLSNGALAIGLVLDAQVRPGEDNFLRPRGEDIPVAERWVSLSPPLPNLERFMDADDAVVVSFMTGQHFVVAWGLVMHDWLFDATLRTIRIHRDELTARLILKATQADGFTVEGTGRVLNDDKWWDVTFEAVGSLGASADGLEAALELTSAKLDICDLDVLEYVKETRTTQSFPSPSSFGSAASILGRLTFEEPEHLVGGLGFWGVGSTNRMEPAVTGWPDYVDFGKREGPGGAPAQAEHPTLLYYLTLPPQNSLRRDFLTVCNLRVRGPDAEHFSAKVASTSSLPQLLRPLDQLAISLAFDGPEARNYDAELRVDTTGGVHRMELRALLAPAQLVSRYQRSFPRNARPICGGAHPPGDPPNLVGIASIVNEGPGSATVVAITLPTSQTDRWAVASATIDHKPVSPIQRTPGRNSWVLAVTGARLLPGSELQIAITHTGEPLAGTTAVLEANTSEGDVRIGLTLPPAAKPDLFEAPSLTASVAQDLRRVCVQLGKGQVLAHEVALDGLVQEIFRRTGDCCPADQQHKCLCVDFLELSFDALPDTAEIVVFDGAEPFFQAPVGGGRLIVPIPSAASSRVVLRGVAGAKAQGFVRPWTLSRTVESVGNETLTPGTGKAKARPQKGTGRRLARGKLGAVPKGDSHLASVSGKLSLKDQVFHNKDEAFSLHLQKGTVEFDQQGIGLQRPGRKLAKVARAPFSGGAALLDHVIATREDGTAELFRVQATELVPVSSFQLKGDWATLNPKGAVAQKGLLGMIEEAPGGGRSVYRLRSPTLATD